MASTVQVEINHGAPPWKLYHNPHYYCFHDGHAVVVASSSSRSSCHGGDAEPPMIVVSDDEDDNGGAEVVVVEVKLDQGYGAMSSELERCVDRIRELRAELELERRMRRKAEALVAEERWRGDAAEAECRALREDAGAVRAEVERVLEEVEEERRMLRVADLWREERVQMKLAYAQAAMEDKLRELDDAVAALQITVSGSRSSSCSSSNSSPVGKSSPRTQHGQQSPSRSQHGQLHRRDAGGGENPHIRRGIKGFVEFPKGVKVVRPREERVDLASNLECQRAQLRVLMRHRSPATTVTGLIGAAENLVV